MELNIKREVIPLKIIDNDIDQPGKRIRLRAVSMANLVSHVKNIPLHINEFNNQDNIGSKNGGFTIIPNYTNSMGFYGNRPINVKTSMLNNIRSKGKFLNSGNDDVVDNNNFDNADLDTALISNDINISFEEISNNRESVLAIKEKADKAVNDANYTDEELVKIGVQETEAQKKLQEALDYQKELNMQISEAIQNQNKILSQMKIHFETIISEADKKREENQNKIMEFKEKIASTESQISSIENENAKKLEILNALKQQVSETDNISLGNENDSVDFGKHVA